MEFHFEHRPAESALIEAFWHTQTTGTGEFTSQAETRSEMVITKYQGATLLTVRGPETEAALVPIPDEGESFGIIFRLGTFMPTLLPQNLSNRRDVVLPEAGGKSFWLHGSAWEFPTFENADTFVERLVREGLLVHESVVDAVMQDQPHDLSLRAVQYRFLRATGLTHGTVRQIQRAQQAVGLLRQGVPILDAVYEAGYADQPHLTRSLRRFMGQTPAEIVRIGTPFSLENM
jgi:AraC-like DNA-binding protein